MRIFHTSSRKEDFFPPLLDLQVRIFPHLFKASRLEFFWHFFKASRCVFFKDFFPTSSRLPVEDFSHHIKASRRGFFKNCFSSRLRFFPTSSRRRFLRIFFSQLFKAFLRIFSHLFKTSRRVFSSEFFLPLQDLYSCIFIGIFPKPFKTST